jgi:hypothetical protein
MMQTPSPSASLATPAGTTQVATPAATSPGAPATAAPMPASPTPAAVVPLACPPAPGLIDLASLLAVPAGKRLACLGRTQMAFRAWVVPQDGRGGTCSGRPAWLTCRLNVPADRVAAGVGTRPTLGVIPDPMAVMPASWGGGLPPGTWVLVTGHFDDPAAVTCADATFQAVDTPARLVRWCRSQFVATQVTMAP